MTDRRYAGVEDLVLLTDVSERGIVANLDKRFSSDEIYTNLGNVLIVCNPFRWLPLYDNNYIKMFNGGQLSELQPHIYAVAESAFKDMLLEDFNQCVIISGESGAGKTEAAKQIMNYIAAVSGSGGNDAQVNKVKNIILDSNPALEAFGNAMTLRNNNSSRFGKYFEINFSASGTPMGGKITNFLLERGRLVTLGKGERSFHIFYQLVTSNNQFKQQLYLSNNPNDYRLLSLSGITQVNNEGGSRNDAKDLEETTYSLETVGILNKGQFNLYTICAAVLHLSNITFVNQKVGSADGSSLSSQQAGNALQSAAAVLQVDANQLNQFLTYRTLVTIAPGKGVETLQVPQNAIQASATRDSLAKDLYARMFDLLVNKVNQSLKAGGAKTRASVRMQMRQSVMNDTQHSLSIGVLDIYGFEIFQDNYFEQFCINYVNEKLQQIFIELTIRAEQEDYEAEGIAWKKIPFFDNKIVCELIEGQITPSGVGKKKPKFGKGARRNVGLFQILDDTAKTITAMDSQVADRRFQDTMFGVHGSHPQLKKAPRGFVVIHYAGDVTYNVDGFVDANRDTLSKDLRLLLKASGNKFVQLLYPEAVDYNDKTMPPSSGYKIKQQANVLIDTLKQCEPHYVRCIKSNSRKAPKLFEKDMVSHQVRYLNLLENVKIRRAGFAYRVKFLDFNRKFKVMGMGVLNEQFYARSNPMQITTQYMQVAAQRVPQLMQAGEVQMGNTKLFIKTPEVLFELQKVRRQMLGDVATKIQRFYRFCKGQKKLFTMKTYMIELFEHHGKPTSPVDVLGNYQAYYIDNPRMKDPIMEIINFYKEQSVVQEKVLYVDRVKRVGKTVDNRPEEIFFVITDLAFYVIRWEAEMEIQKKMRDFFKKKRTTAIVKTDDMGNVQRRLVLKKRIQLNQIRELGMTQLADDMLKITCQVEQQQPENKEGWTDMKNVKRCMQSQEPFSFFGKSKNRCHFTGGVYIKELMSTATVPDRGFYEPVPVLATMANKVRTEMQEDVIIESEHKGEICAVFMEAITKLKERNNPYAQRGPYGAPPPSDFNPRSCSIQPTFSNSWNISGAEPLGFSWNTQLYCQMAPGIRELVFTANPDGSFTANVPSDGVSAERQQRLKAFLYKREERKKAEIRQKQQLREEARANRLRYEQEDKQLRAQQRAERKAKRANGVQPVQGYNRQNSNIKRNPFAGTSPFGAQNSGPNLSSSGKNAGLPPLPTNRNTNQSYNRSASQMSGNSYGGSARNGPPALPATGSKPSFGGNQFGGSQKPLNKAPSFGANSFGGNQFGGSQKPLNKAPSFGANSFGGSKRNTSFGGNQFGGSQELIKKAPSFGAKKPSFNGSQKSSFGGNQFGVNRKPSFGGNKPSFTGSQKPSFGASKFGGKEPPLPGINKQPSFGGSQKAVPSFGGSQKPSFGGSQKAVPSFGGSQKPSFGGSQKAVPSFGGSQKPSIGGSQKPSFGGSQQAVPAFGGNNGQQRNNYTTNTSGSFMGKQSSQPPAPRSRFQGPDWQRVHDPNTNRYYFFNFKTQESVWDES